MDKGNTLKKCGRCGLEKSLSQFYRIGRGKEQRRSMCIDCYKEGIQNKNRNLKKEVLSHYSITNPPSCAVCGKTKTEELCLDHVNGGGRKHLKSIGLYNPKYDKIVSGVPFYRWLKRKDFPNNPPLQVLCIRHNQIKQIVNHER